MSSTGGPSVEELEASEAAFNDAAARFDEPHLPPTSFTDFVLSLQHEARVHLGDAPAPGTNQLQRELALARQTIDLLTLLDQRTHGNLSGEEERLLHQAMHDLRQRFVEVAKQPRS